MVQDLWDTRWAILTGVPVPGTQSRLHKGVNESYAEVQSRHSKAVSSPTHREAQAFIGAYQPPATVILDDCAAPDLVIFPNGSYTPAGALPARSGWGFVVQPGDVETAIHEGSGLLITPE